MPEDLIEKKSNFDLTLSQNPFGTGSKKNAFPPRNPGEERFPCNIIPLRRSVP